MSTMPKPQREKYLANCRKRVQSAKKFRKDEGYDEKWERLTDLYRGKQFGAAKPGEDRIAVNVVFSNINTIWASISTNYPKISVNARKPEEHDQATVVDALINYWWRTKNIKPEIQLAQKESLILGCGWLKTGYRFVEKEQPRSADAIAAELQERNSQLDIYAEDNPDMAGELPTPEELAAMIPDTEMVTVHDAPFVERVSPFDVFVDPEATSLRDAKWVAQRIYRTIEEVKTDKKYKNSRSGVQADAKVDDTSTPKDKEYTKCSVYEYYDLRKGTMCVFAENGDDFLVDPIDQPYEFGAPFVFIPNYEIPGKFYPIGEVEAIEDLQNELNKTRSQQMNHRKRGNRKFLYDGRAFSQSAVGDLVSDIDGVAVRVNDGIPLNEAIIPLPVNGIDPQLYQYSEQIESDINSISGVTDYQRGGASQSIRRSATEASIIAEASNSRAADKLARYELVNAEIARRLVMLAQQYMTNDASVRIMGKNGLPIWGNIEPDYIKGEFDFEVEAGSTKPKNEAYLMQQATQLFQALMPVAQSGIINVAELAKFFIEQGFGIKDASRFINPQQGQPMVDPQTGAPLGDPGGQLELEDPNAMPQDPMMQGIPPEVLQQLQGQVNYPAEGAIPNGG